MGPSKAVVRPDWYTPEREFIGTGYMATELRAENAVLTMTSHFYPRIVKLPGFKDKGKAPSMNGAADGRLGNRMVVYDSSVGAPAAAMLMESLIASGVKRFLMLGVAGSLSQDCRIGDIVVPTWGVREEGTSYHYLPGSAKVAPSKRLVSAIEKSLGADVCKTGGVWTTDAPYRETKGKIRKYAKLGVIAVDMETTALMAVAMSRRVDFASVLVISDEAFGEKWVPEFHGPKVRRTCDLVCKSALGLMSKG